MSAGIFKNVICNGLWVKCKKSHHTSHITHHSGFTLIELMVTITIIAILASIGLVVYSTVQKTARISKRVQDLQALQTAIELFKSSTGKYPVAATNFVCLNSLTGANSLSPTYTAVVPNDPLSGYCYEYRSDDGIDYKLRNDPDLYSGEMQGTDFDQQPGLIDPARDGGDGSATNPCTIENGANPRNGWAFYTQGACNWY